MVFKLTFKETLEKKDSFQIMYEVFLDDKKKIIETGNILYANLKLSGEDNQLYYFDSKKMRDIMIKVEKVFKKL